jgi:hypothetical protein
MFARLERVFVRRNIATLLRALRKPKPTPENEAVVEAASREGIATLLTAIERDENGRAAVEAASTGELNP